MRILIADDEEEMTQALSAILKHEHYSVDTVHDGMAALDYGMAESCDCLVLDIMMPGLDGLQVLKKLRENGISTPVLLLTAKGEVEDRVAGLDCGADDYLPKPFDVREFLAEGAFAHPQGRYLYAADSYGWECKPQPFHL